MASTVRMADSSDMYMIHRLIRREFAAIPGLVRAVPPGDRRRTAELAGHVTMMTTLLHHHHTGEDELVWPKLLERGPQEIAPLVATMERQHHVVDRALTEVAERLAAWQRTAAVAEAGALAAAFDALLPPLLEHLDTEETHLLALIDKYLTEKEWAQVAQAASARTPKSQAPVGFGMALYEASPEHLRVIKDALPGPLWFVMSRIGPRAYAKYATRIHGTPTPARSTV